MPTRAAATIVRPYQPVDRTALRQIAYSTAFLESPSEFFDDEEILSDILTLYFTDYEPESSLVAVAADGRVVGYLIGAVDTHRLDWVGMFQLGPRILWKSLQRGTLGRGKVLVFLWHLWVSFCRGEFFLSDFSRQYPATFHINLLKEFRGQGVGEHLVRAYYQYLQGRGVKAVRVSTFSEGAKRFFMKLGLTPLIHGPRSFLKYRLGRDARVYILGKKL